MTAAQQLERGLNASYKKLFSASVISNLGDGIGVIAYPWLASAVTRNPILIALVAVVQRLPWLVFTLPAGVLTDRHDRRTIIATSNAVRAALTFAVAVGVFAQRNDLPTADEITAGIVHDSALLYVLVLLATLLLGIAEVMGDNATQTFMPSIVHPDDLEKANGRLWSMEMVANNFAGPPLGALFLAWSFTLPFVVDAASFAVAAVLVALIPPAQRLRRASSPESGSAPDTPRGMKAEIAEGFRWLWSHDLLRPMAIILGLLNLAGIMTFSVFVLFAQEVLETSPAAFAIVMMGNAVGGVLGGWTASSIAQRIGSGPSLALTLITGAATALVIGLTSLWPVVFVMFALGVFTGTLWNVITVSLRQTIIPDELLGRVNSVYRFFAWGMMPIGAILGGVIVAVTEVWGSRELALRMPFFAAAALQLVLLAFALPRLTTEKMDAARAEALGDTEEVAPPAG